MLRYLSLYTAERQRLVIVMDDLQWADDWTLRVILKILNESHADIVIVGECVVVAVGCDSTVYGR